MKALELAMATDPLERYARNLRGDTVVLTLKGKPIAALVPIEDMDLETLAVSTNPEFIALIERSRARQAAEGGISVEDMRERLGITNSDRKRKRNAP